MTEQEAKARCAELMAESPERSTHSWIPREGADGVWAVVKLGVPSPSSPENLKTTERQAPKGIKDDPRTAIEQNIPPWSMGF